MPRITIGGLMIVVAAVAGVLVVLPWLPLLIWLVMGLLLMLCTWPMPLLGLGLAVSALAWAGTARRPKRRPWYLAAGLITAAAFALAMVDLITPLLCFGVPIVLTLALRSVLTDDRATRVGRGMPLDEFLLYALAAVCVFGVPVLSVAYLIVALA